jgi:hypothetical protein
MYTICICICEYICILCTYMYMSTGITSTRAHAHVHAYMYVHARPWICAPNEAFMHRSYNLFSTEYQRTHFYTHTSSICDNLFSIEYQRTHYSEQFSTHTPQLSLEAKPECARAYIRDTRRRDARRHIRATGLAYLPQAWPVAGEGINVRGLRPTYKHDTLTKTHTNTTYSPRHMHWDECLRTNKTHRPMLAHAHTVGSPLTHGKGQPSQRP